MDRAWPPLAGLLGRDVVFSHCNVLTDRAAPDDDMWAALKESGAAVAATPEDELGMAHGNPVGLDALSRGVHCGLGVVSILYVRSSRRCTDVRAGRNVDQWRRPVHADARHAAVGARTRPRAHPLGQARAAVAETKTSAPEPQPSSASPPESSVPEGTESQASLEEAAKALLAYFAKKEGFN